MSRGLVLGRGGVRILTSSRGASSEIASVSITGSAACAQQPHVTQVGGHVASPRSRCSYLEHGSAITRLETPDALNISNATMTRWMDRSTGGDCTIRRGRSRQAGRERTMARSSERRGSLDGPRSWPLVRSTGRPATLPRGAASLRAVVLGLFSECLKFRESNIELGLQLGHAFELHGRFAAHLLDIVHQREHDFRREPRCPGCAAWAALATRPAWTSRPSFPACAVCGLLRHGLIGSFLLRGGTNQSVWDNPEYIWAHMTKSKRNRTPRGSQATGSRSQPEP